MGIDAKYNNEYWGGSNVKHRGVCPSGWHLPSGAEWTTLTDFVGFAAGAKLKATRGWCCWSSSTGVYVYLSNDTDEFGFSALPGGFGYSDGSFRDVGSLGLWWSASEANSSRDTYGRGMYGYNAYVGYYYYGGKGGLYSVRCLQD